MMSVVVMTVPVPNAVFPLFETLDFLDHVLVFAQLTCRILGTAGNLRPYFLGLGLLPFLILLSLSFFTLSVGSVVPSVVVVAFAVVSCIIAFWSGPFLVTRLFEMILVVMMMMPTQQPSYEEIQGLVRTMMEFK